MAGRAGKCTSVARPRRPTTRPVSDGVDRSRPSSLTDRVCLTCKATVEDMLHAQGGECAARPDMPALPALAPSPSPCSLVQASAKPSRQASRSHPLPPSLFVRSPARLSAALPRQNECLHQRIGSNQAVNNPAPDNHNTKQPHHHHHQILSGGEDERTNERLRTHPTTAAPAV